MRHNQYTLLVEETNRNMLLETEFFNVINEAEEGGFFSRLGAKADRGVEKTKQLLYSKQGLDLIAKTAADLI